LLQQQEYCHPFCVWKAAAASALLAKSVHTAHAQQQQQEQQQQRRQRQRH
jgi:hemolysin activation/secretion protein